MAPRSLVSALVVAASVTALLPTVASSQPPPPPPSAPQPIAAGFGAGAYRPHPQVTEPVALRRVEPQYTAAAMQAGIEGEVHLQAIIGTGGSVQATRVTRSLDQRYGLDEEAVKAARQWLFKPATYQGKPVPIAVTLVLEFGKRPAQQRPPYGTRWIDDAEFLKGVARIGDPNVTMPIVERSVTPKYTSDAMRAKLSGNTTVDLVVAPDGTVARVRLVRSLDPVLGLDDESLAAAKLWTFKPGLVNGKPAHVLVTVTLEFRLH